MLSKILEVAGLVKKFGDITAVNGISFDVRKKEIVGFIGPNGSGKTTTLKLITNLIWPDRGSISISGYDLIHKREAALSQVSGIIENPGLYLNLSGYDNMKFIRDVRRVSKARFDECVEITGLGRHLKRPAGKYSLGMKQRLALGMCLLTNPPLLILDEPTNGLDPTGVVELRELLAEMSKSHGTSILFSSHQLGEVEKLADRVIFIKQGEILTELTNDSGTADAPAKAHYTFEVSDAGLAVSVLSEFEPERTGSSVIVRGIKDKEGFGKVLMKLRDASVEVYDIEKRRITDSLEETYYKLYLSGGRGGNVG